MPFSENSVEHAHFVLGNTCGKALQTVPINCFPICWFLCCSPNSSISYQNYIKSLLWFECKMSPICSCVWKISSNVYSIWKIMKPQHLKPQWRKSIIGRGRRHRLWGYSLFTLFSDRGHSTPSCFTFLLQCLPDFHVFLFKDFIFWEFYTVLYLNHT